MRFAQYEHETRVVPSRAPTIQSTVSAWTKSPNSMAPWTLVAWDSMGRLGTVGGYSMSYRLDA